MVDISRFRAELNENNGGIIPTNAYHVMFSPFGGSSSLSSLLGTNNQALIMRCENVILPGPTLMKEETIRRYGMGPLENMPYAVQFGELAMTWVIDKRSEVVEFFQHWMKNVVNYDSKGGADMTGKDRTTGFSPYEVGYKDDYSNRQMNVFVYDRRGNRTMEYEIYDLFPVAINDMDMSHGDMDNALRMTVRFAFTDMHVHTPRAGNGVLERITSILTNIGVLPPSFDIQNEISNLIVGRNSIDNRITTVPTTTNTIGSGQPFVN